jgi:hypothetical protein
VFHGVFDPVTSVTLTDDVQVELRYVFFPPADAFFFIFAFEPDTADVFVLKDTEHFIHMVVKVVHCLFLKVLNTAAEFL